MVEMMTLMTMSEDMGEAPPTQLRRASDTTPDRESAGVFSGGLDRCHEMLVLRLHVEDHDAIERCFDGAIPPGLVKHVEGPAVRRLPAGRQIDHQSDAPVAKVVGGLEGIAHTHRMHTEVVTRRAQGR